MYQPSSVPICDCGSFGFDVVTPWPQPSADVGWVEVTAVAVDAHDRVHVFARQPDQVFVFNGQGALLYTWGTGCFARPHGLTIDAHGNFYCTDDLDHTVKVFSPDYEHKFTIGTSGVPSNTGATSIDYRTIRRAGPPFYFPTNVAVAADGTFYVSDGYGNARIHHFSPEGKLIGSWGEPGSEPGQFHVPHGIAIASNGAVYVADRENSRIQIFSPSGTLVDIWEDIARPCQLAFDREGNVMVAELGYLAGMWPGTSAPSPQSTGGRVSILDATGKLLGRFGGGSTPTAAGDFFAPHDIAFNTQGDFFVAEVVHSAGGRRGMVPPDCHAIQKFCRRHL
ncbi:MAG: peptidyl-alpha-hydroxyglycine alpha-amidating lyase family protein [Planctomycetota bacterium]|nr:peptidyl-alpha-hydroxyglycine alpha-amidating lyase family protein [Planctomycetota bacterium]MDA1180236.1 peptidyl-alpha-hydroxyglycine alpha-amidating lyase family protein [Planctomycetota bacterium]